MEIERQKLDMSKLESYVRLYDNVFKEETLDVFLKICNSNHFHYEGAKVLTPNGGQSLDTDIRNVKSMGLSNLYSKSLTTAHWASLLLNKFTSGIKTYITDLNMDNFGCRINDIQVLKYVPGGHYKFHIDDNTNIHRVLSLIYFVNDDYEGGDLVFKLIGTEEVLKVEKKKNRLIIWPSNFMYPHSVTPVLKGIRYSVVAWAS